MRGEEGGGRQGGEKKKNRLYDFIIDKINNHALYKPNARYEVLRRRKRRRRRMRRRLIRRR